MYGYYQNAAVSIPNRQLETGQLRQGVRLYYFGLAKVGMAMATVPSDEAIEAAAMGNLAAFDLEALKPLQFLLPRSWNRCLRLFPYWLWQVDDHILPSVCSHLASSGFTRFPPDPIVLVVSPLKSPVRDQFSILSTRGISAAVVGDSKQPDSNIMAGKFSFRVCKATTTHPANVRRQRLPWRN